MNSILYCSDLHGNKKLYELLISTAKKEKIQNIVIGGDICPHIRNPDLQVCIDYQKEFLKGFLLPAIKESGLMFYLIMGNDDFRANNNILEAADKNKILILIHKKAAKIFNYSIIGYSFVPQMPFLLKDWEKMDDGNAKPLTPPERDIRTAEKESGTIKSDLEEIKPLSNPKNTIYVIHTPPHNTNLDIIHAGIHVGSRSVREFIEEEQPPLTLHGHIHESPEVSGKWKDKIGSTICINIGSEHLNSVLNYCIIDLANLKNIRRDSIK